MVCAQKEPLEQQLSRLETLIGRARGAADMAAAAKAKRLRLLRNEATRIRRRLSQRAGRGATAAVTRSASPAKTINAVVAAATANANATTTSIQKSPAKTASLQKSPVKTAPPADAGHNKQVPTVRLISHQV